tara:strand:+ start:411 stop:563 length:153 start_codon:yes stop_codon:yes gene_type:complete
MECVRIKYEGRVIHDALPLDQAAEILDLIAEEYYEGAPVDPSKIEVEPIS